MAYKTILVETHEQVGLITLKSPRCAERAQSGADARTR